MKNIKIYFLIILSIFLVSCSFDNFKQEIQTQEPEAQITENSEINYKKIIEETDETIINSENFNSCIIPNIYTCINNTAHEIASKEWNIEICNKLKEDSQKDSCKLGIILEKNSEITDCDAISEDYLKLVCKSNIIQIKAQNDNYNTNLCNEIENLDGDKENLKAEKDSCVNNLIIDNPNSKIEDCEKLELEDNKNFCKNFIESNEEFNKNFNSPISEQEIENN